MKNENTKAIMYAVAAALFYAVNVPCSKMLLANVPPVYMAVFLKEGKPELKYIVPTLVLGFVAYGLSIFTYIRAQKMLGAVKTSAYYALAPFFGVFLSFILLRESLTASYLVALGVMILGIGIIAYDTLLHSHQHIHQHS